MYARMTLISSDDSIFNDNATRKKTFGKKKIQTNKYTWDSLILKYYSHVDR